MNTLTQDSIDKLHAHSGLLCLLLEAASAVKTVQGERRYDLVLERLEGVIEQTSPKFFNDLGFIKDIYNRQRG